MLEQFSQIYGYLHGMWRYRWSALLFTWLVAVIGWLIVFALPDQYEAEAVVYVDTTSVMKPLLKGLAPETDSQDELAIMSRVLLSRENLLSVIRETDMDLEVDSPDERESLVESLAGAITLTGGGSGKRWEKRSNIYEISYRSTSAERAYQVVSNLLNTMIENTLNSTRTDTVAAQKFLDTQIAEYEQRLSVSEQRLAEFKKANVGFMPDEKGNYYARLQRAQESAESTRSDLRLAEQRAVELTKQLKGEKPLLDSDSYQSANAIRLRHYQEQLDAMLNQYTEQHPDVQSLRSAIDELQANPTSGDDVEHSSSTGDAIEFNPVYQQIKGELSRASIEVETLKIQLAEQRAYVVKLRESIDVIPEVEARLAKLNRDYEVTRERYLDLVERRESAKLAQSAGQTASDVTFRIIEPPIVPSRPSGPKRLLLLAGFLAAAVGAGLGWSFLRYTMQPTYFSLRQLGDNIGLPVLGSVSLYLSPRHKRRRRFQLASFISVAVLLVFVSGGVIWYRDLGTRIVGSLITNLVTL